MLFSINIITKLFSFVKSLNVGMFQLVLVLVLVWTNLFNWHKTGPNCRYDRRESSSSSSSSSSSCRAASTDIPDPLSPLSFIASGRSSGLHPASSHSCCMYVRAGRPAFARPYAGVHKSTSLMSSSLLLQQCPACLVRLNWIVFVIGGRWPYSWCLVGCCRQDLFNIARNIRNCRPAFSPAV